LWCCPSRPAALSAFAVACAVTCAPALASAQPKPRHQGLNIAVVLGQGKLHTACETCRWPTTPGAPLLHPAPPEEERANLISLRAGWTLHDLAIVFAEGTFLRRTVASGDLKPIETAFDAYTLGAMLYASRRSEAFFKLGFGVSHGRRRVLLASDTLRSYLVVTNPAYRIGVGYDLRIGRTWSLTPTVEYVGTTARKSESFEYDRPVNPRTPGVLGKNRVWVFALGLTFP